MIDTDPPLILDAVALRRRRPRPDCRFFARDIAQWWLYPPSTRLRQEVVAVGQPDLERMQMFAEVLPLLGSSDRQELMARLLEWQRRCMPEWHTDHGGWPALGFLIDHRVHARAPSVAPDVEWFQPVLEGGANTGGAGGPVATDGSDGAWIPERNPLKNLSRNRMP